MRVLIAAGGTGGHIYPGVAVAHEVLRRDETSKVLFVGTARGLETKIVPDNGFQLSLIHSAGLKNVGLVGKLKGLMILPKSFFEARTIIRDFKPDVVVGAGGYVSGPVLLMAAMMRIPTLVMDSNALPGFTNRRLAPFVTAAALTFEEAVPYFGKKGVVTGNPVRSEFFDIEPKPRGAKVSVLIFGGSQGARAINNAMAGALGLLPSAKFEITHQTGEADFDAIRTQYEASEFAGSDIRPYITNMVEEFAAADIVICRAGATTCAELAAAGKASLMVPLPTAADDHQRKNAEALVRAGAARMILQSDLTPESFAAALTELVDDPESIGRMEAAAKSLARPDAACAAVDLMEKVSGKE